MEARDALDWLKKEEVDLSNKLSFIRNEIKSIHAKRKELDPLYCEYCEQSPCENNRAYYEDDED